MEKWCWGVCGSQGLWGHKEREYKCAGCKITNMDQASVGQMLARLGVSGANSGLGQGVGLEARVV